MKVILASQSPRRKELMDLLNIDYEIIVSQVDEVVNDSYPIKEQSKELAYIKAKEVFNKTTGDRIVIGADTLVTKDNKIYGKPKDENDAIRILKELNGLKHEVITGLCVLIQKEDKYYQYIDYDLTEVYVKHISDEDIVKYVKQEKPLDKAGGYAIQDSFCLHIEKIVGNYTSVVGLPVQKLYDIIRKFL